MTHTEATHWILLSTEKKEEKMASMFTGEPSYRQVMDAVREKTDLALTILRSAT